MSDQPRRDHEALAAALAEARKRLRELALPAADADRLHRQFIAVCNAVKAPEADAETGLRRLAAFLATLEGAAAQARGNKSHTENSVP
jgi:hypothetical protein